MALLVNLRHLEDKNLHLRGEFSVADLELERLDEMIHVSRPLSYDLEVQKLDQGVLVQGRLALMLDCECVRCLGGYRHFLKLDHWACHLALSGEEKIEVLHIPKQRIYSIVVGNVVAKIRHRRRINR